MSEPLERSVTVRCSVEHAFSVFSARIDLWWPRGHRRFDQSRLSLEPGVGGRFFERTESGEEADLGQVLYWDPPNRLTYTWLPGSRTGPTEVDVQFSSQGDVTLVSITHSAGQIGEAWSQRVTLFARAWGVVLPAFKDHIEKLADGEHETGEQR